MWRGPSAKVFCLCFHSTFRAAVVDAQDAEMAGFPLENISCTQRSHVRICGIKADQESVFQACSSARLERLLDARAIRYNSEMRNFCARSRFILKT